MNRTAHPTLVFVSSVVSGFEDLRDAAAQAIADLGHENINLAAIRCEDFPALAAFTPAGMPRGCASLRTLYWTIWKTLQHSDG